MNFHSEEALKQAIGNGNIRPEKFSQDIIDWDREADLVLNMGFPGSQVDHPA